MKIAVPTKNANVDSHFGHCDHYTIFTVENNHIIGQEEFASPNGCGCKTGLAADLKNIGVSVMLAGNMGEGALSKLSDNGIEVVRGCSGNIENVVNSYLKGELKDSGVGCTSHEDGHECHHEHNHSHCNNHK